jgi:dipeptidyl aminopeptidase/acylaminoacyl peptidase
MADFTWVEDPTLDDTFRFELVEKIAFSSTRDNPTGNPFFTAEIYLINPDGTDPQRLTNNSFADSFAMLSPDGKKIVFDSNRLTADPLVPQTWNVDDLFVMDADGTNQELLTRGSSATWSPDGKDIAFHASASYYTSGGTDTGDPLNRQPGAATTDSDLFVANVDELAAAPDVLTKTQLATNITNTPLLIESDADWSASPTTAPGGQSIVFISDPVGDHPEFSNQAEIYVINPDGTEPLQLTRNDYEERAPSWSPDGTRIVFSARIGGDQNDFEICVMNADGSGFQQLTNNTVFDLTPSWSPDGTQIAFQRPVPGQGIQMFTMNPELNPDGTLPVATQVTFGPGINLIGQWGEVRTHVGSDTPDGADETFFAGSQEDYSIQTLDERSFLFGDGYLLA